MVEGFALVAAQTQEQEWAAVLLGASSTRATGGGIRLDREDRLRLEAKLRKELGRERFEAAWSKGTAMTPEGAVERALAEPAPDASSPGGDAGGIGGATLEP